LLTGGQISCSSAPKRGLSQPSTSACIYECGSRWGTRYIFRMQALYLRTGSGSQIQNQKRERRRHGGELCRENSTLLAMEARDRASVELSGDRTKHSLSATGSRPVSLRRRIKCPSGRSDTFYVQDSYSKASVRSTSSKPFWGETPRSMGTEIMTVNATDPHKDTPPSPSKRCPGCSWPNASPLATR